MSCPRFSVAAGHAYGEGWIAFTATGTDPFGPFEWVWWGGDEVLVGAYYGELPEEQRSIPIADAQGPVIARTPEAFAAFLAGRYSNPETVQALVQPWETQRARERRELRRRLLTMQRRAWLRRLIGLVLPRSRVAGRTDPGSMCDTAAAPFVEVRPTAARRRCTQLGTAGFDRQLRPGAGLLVLSGGERVKR